MKIETVDNKVEASGSFKKHGFKIKAGAKAFQVLSSTLYSNKIRAFVRETVCNAADSLKGGAEFKVTMPTVFTPEFRVRDFGTGISEENMFHIYTTYFESTKESSNDEIGGFGLGSKSPFAYTNSFEVTSYFDGMMKVYTVFLDNSEPNITKVAEFPSDEPCGLEVVIPIKTEDFDDVIKESKYILRDFKKFTCNHPEFKDYKHYPDDDMFTTDDLFGGYALMGGILYPIPQEYYKGTWFAHMAKNGAAIRFGIGELDISPSREQLSFDDDTKEAIRTRIVEISKVDMKQYMDIIAEAKTLRAANHIINGFSLGSDAKSVLKYEAVINGINISAFESRCNIGGKELIGLNYIKCSMKNNRLADVTGRRYGYFATKIGYNSLVELYRKHLDIVVRDDEKAKIKPLEFIRQKGINDAIVIANDPVKLAALHSNLKLYYDDSEIIYHKISTYIKPAVEKVPTERSPRKERLYQYFELKDGVMHEYNMGCISKFKTLKGKVVFNDYGSLYNLDGTAKRIFGNFANAKQWVEYNGIDCYILPKQVIKSTSRNAELVDLEDTLTERYKDAVSKMTGVVLNESWSRANNANKIIYLVNNYGTPEQRRVFDADDVCSETNKLYKWVAELSQFDHRYHIPIDVFDTQREHYEKQVAMADEYIIRHSDFGFATDLLIRMCEYDLNKHPQKLLKIIFD